MYQTTEDYIRTLQKMQKTSLEETVTRKQHSSGIARPSLIYACPNA